ncbi:hypothetical protein [Flavobacterium chungnamense]
MSKIRILFLFLLMMQLSNGQVTPASKKINGKVTADYNDLESIYIVNLKTEKSTLTERGGYFSINASVGDTLMFTAVQFKSVKIALKEEDFNKELLFVKMETFIRVLDEVKINEYKDINAVSLGIISSKTKHYTPAERKLHEATTGSGLVPLNPILNAITGRTKQLKKEVEVEKKETMLSKIENLYEAEYFTETLKIPKDFVKGFQYYIVEDAKFVEALKAKNKTMATFIMNELAVTYKELIAVKP